MKNDVMIRLVTKQITEDSENETTEITTKGILEQTDEGYELSYDETDEEMKDSRTTIAVTKPGLVTMTRTGSYSSQIIIQKNTRHNCHYMTPFGGLMMGVYASEVHSTLTGHGGKINLHYTIDFNSSMVAENTVTVIVKPIPESGR